MNYKIRTDTVYKTFEQLTAGDFFQINDNLLIKTGTTTAFDFSDVMATNILKETIVTPKSAEITLL